MGYFTAASGGQQQGDSMQSFTAKAGIGALALAIAAVSFLAGSAIDDANAQRGQEAQLSTRGIEWPNFSTGADHNANERNAPGGHKVYFAEIHLLIPLGKDTAIINAVNRYADLNDTTKLRDLLIRQLKGPDKYARPRLINNLVLRP
jgi:hypothetical protein